MNRKTSLFDWRIVKHDLVRFAPMWIIYLFGGLLISQVILDAPNAFRSAHQLNGFMGEMSLINLCYAGMLAYIMFSYLHKKNAIPMIQSLPISRDGWLGSHSLAALLMSLLPNTIIALLMLPPLDEYGLMAPAWLLVMAVEFIFFFALALLAMECSGNMVGYLTVYVILNLLPVFADAIYHSIVHGVLQVDDLQLDVFTVFSPLLMLGGLHAICYNRYLFDDTNFFEHIFARDTGNFQPEKPWLYGDSYGVAINPDGNGYIYMEPNESEWILDILSEGCDTIITIPFAGTFQINPDTPFFICSYDYDNYSQSVDSVFGYFMQQTLGLSDRMIFFVYLLIVLLGAMILWRVALAIHRRRRTEAAGHFLAFHHK